MNASSIAFRSSSLSQAPAADELNCTVRHKALHWHFLEPVGRKPGHTWSPVVDTKTTSGDATVSMSQPDVLNELLLRSAKGDRKAFARLYSLASPKLYALCLRVVKQEALAEEVLQEAFVKIWNHAQRFEPGKASAMTWMSSIVRNRALDILRSLKTQPEQIETTYEGIEFSSTNPGPMDSAQLSADAKAVMDCMEKLQEQQRRCIMLAYYEGHTHDELSRMLDTPLGTVKAWIRRGLERLRQCLG